MKKLFLVAGVCLLPFSGYSQSLLEDTVLQQILQEERLNNMRTKQLVNRLAELIEVQNQALDMQDKKLRSEMEGPNTLLIGNQKMILENHKNDVIKTAKSLIDQVKSFEHLDKKDYLNTINRAQNIVLMTKNTYIQINQLLNNKSNIIPANERIEVLNNGIDVFEKNLGMIKGYIVELKILNDQRKINRTLNGF